MLTAQEFEPIVREALDTVIQHGYTLICVDWGVDWDAATQQWAWDRSGGSPRCDALGALLLSQQPDIPPELHGGDPFTCALLALDADRVWIRDFCNGFDGLPYQGETGFLSGGYEDIYDLGVQLSKTYRALNNDLMSMTNDDFLVAAAG